MEPPQAKLHPAATDTFRTFWAEIVTHSPLIRQGKPNHVDFRTKTRRCRACGEAALSMQPRSCRHAFGAKPAVWQVAFVSLCLRASQFFCARKPEESGRRRDLSFDRLGERFALHTPRYRVLPNLPKLSARKNPPRLGKAVSPLSHLPRNPYIRLHHGPPAARPVR